MWLPTKVTCPDVLIHPTYLENQVGQRFCNYSTLVSFIVDWMKTQVSVGATKEITLFEVSPEYVIPDDGPGLSDPREYRKHTMDLTHHAGPVIFECVMQVRGVLCLYHIAPSSNYVKIYCPIHIHERAQKRKRNDYSKLRVSQVYVDDIGF